jgi:hypothetical protein
MVARVKRLREFNNAEQAIACIGMLAAVAFSAEAGPMLWH